MQQKVSPKLYPNQVFLFNGINYNRSDDTCFVKLILANGKTGFFKVVEPIPVDNSRTVLEGATKKSLDEGIKRIINTKYTNKNIYLSDEVLDKIEEIIDAMKLPRKEKRKKLEELEKIEQDKIKEKLKQEEFEKFFNSRMIFQANGIFMSEKGGLIQIPSDTRYKQQNIHRVSIDNPLIELTFINKETKKVLTIKDLETIDNSDIKVFTKVNFLSTIKSYRFLFEINGYLINKLSDKKNSKTNIFDVYNLINFYCDPQKDKEYSSFIYNNFQLPINKIIKKYKQNRKSFSFTEQEKNELKTIYRNFYQTIILHDTKNKIYQDNIKTIEKYQKEYKELVPPILDINISLYIYEDKIKNFIEYITKFWTDTNNSMFNIIKNKDKIDYFQCLKDLELKNILGTLKLTKVFDDMGKDSLHDIYKYPKKENIKKATPRIMAYSIMDNSFIPNVEPVTDGKLKGFSLYKESIDNLREKCK